MNNNRTVVLAFYCKDFYQLSLKSKISAITMINEDLTEVRVKPAAVRSKLFPDGRYGVCLAVTKYLPKRMVTSENRYRKIRVAINPRDFGLTAENFIEDSDGRLLFRELEKSDFELYPIRTTCNN